jgi:hypothetical protein
MPVTGYQGEVTMVELKEEGGGWKTEAGSREKKL